MIIIVIGKGLTHIWLPFHCKHQALKRLVGCRFFPRNIKRDRVVCKACQQTLALQVHFSRLSSNTPLHVLSTYLISSSIFGLRSQKMSLKAISLPLLFAMFAALAVYTHVSIPNHSKFIKHLVGLGLKAFSSSPFDSAPMVFSALDSHLHRHKHHEDGDMGSICDDFPPDFPPPDTNTTSILCVDRRGCCNFTAVQAAVDAVSALSQKRTIIWINSGVY